MLDEHLHSKLIESVDSLPLSTRTLNLLARNGIQTIVDMLCLQQDDLSKMGVGSSTMAKIKSVTQEYLSLLVQKHSIAEIRRAIKEIRGLRSATPQPSFFLDSGQASISLDDSLKTLPLSTRPCNALLRSGIRTVGDLLSTPEHRIKAIRNVGEKAFREIQSVREELQSSLSLEVDIEIDSLPELKSSLPDSIANKLMDLGINELADLSQYTVEDLVIHAHLTYFEARQVSETLSTTDISLATCWPEHPLVSSGDYQFLKRAGVPIDDISVSRLALPIDLERRLQSLGIETVDAVASQSQAALEAILGTYGKEYVDMLVKNLGAYFAWLLTQNNWDGEIANQGVSPLYFVWLKETTLEKIINSLLSYIPHEKDRKVIRLRFGLDGRGQRTLQQLGDWLGVTRERISQLGKRSIDRLKKGTRDGLVRSLYISIEDEMRIRGGLMSVTQIGEHITDLMDVGEVDQDGAVSLLLSLEPDHFVEIQKRKRWGLKGAPLNLVKPITQEIVKILQAVHAPLPQTGLMDRLTQKEWYAQLEDKDQLSTKLIIACLSTDDRFEETEDGQWGLTRWRKKRTDEIVMALRKLGKPSHHTEIARITNEMLPPSLRTSNRNIYAQLQQKSNLFVWVGPGTYGLAEWGLKRPRFYVDIAAELLEQQGEPLAFEEIFPAINAEREASPESIKFMLDTNPRFRQYPENKFGLTSWLEELDEEKEDDTDDPFLEDLKRRLFDDLK